MTRRAESGSYIEVKRGPMDATPGCRTWPTRAVHPAVLLI